MKKNLFLISILTFILLIAASTDVDAQHRRHKKKKKKKKEDTEYFDESGGFKHRLWYGLSGALNFNNQGNVRVFNLGISPMVGFKIIEPVSVGPRFIWNNLFLKAQNSNGDIISDVISEYGAGLFARYKPFRQIFAHVEYEYITSEDILQSNGSLLLDPNDPTKFLTEKKSKDNLYLGIGYTSGSIVSYEAMLLYNALQEKNTLDLPFSLRISFTYKF